ncbi:MAG: DUF1573 domain-containing protein [Pontiellaceae bacterium]|nr:DUF1573 domain-containing protein [Pontiellaceae bacterium]
MMNGFYRFVVIGLWGLAAVSAEALPKLECFEPEHDFGEQVAKDQEIVHRFTLLNTGSEPVKILEIKDCCGVSSTVMPMTIPPGSTAVCTSGFDTSNRYGNQEKQILLVTDIQKTPYIDLRMTGTLLRAIEYSPAVVRFENLMPDGSASATITATNLLAEAVTLESATTTIEGFEVEVVAGDQEAQRSWTIHLKSNAPLAVGQISGMLKLNFPTSTVSVLVVGDVAPIVQATPEQIQFSSTSTGAVKRMAMLRSGDGRAFDLLSAELKDAEGTVSFKKLSADKWQLSLSVQAESVAPGAAVEVKTSLESQPLIRIPLVK